MTAAQLLAVYVRDLLQQPEGEVVVLGRTNVDRNDLTSLRIAVDTLGPAKRLNSSKKYDGDAELMHYGQQWNAPCVVNFIGDGAYDEAVRFMLISDGQEGYEIQRDAGIGVYLTSSLTDVKQLTGEEFSCRFELQLNLQYTLNATESVLRIDDAQISITED